MGYNPGYEWDKWGQCPLITGVITHLLSGMNHQVTSDEISKDMNYWLVVSRHPSEKYEFVNWDDEISNINGKITNQINPDF